MDGVYRQLNTNILQIENEFYGSVRPKQVAQTGERPLVALATRGGSRLCGERSRCTSVGGGVVGLLVAAIAARLPGADVTVVDVQEGRVVDLTFEGVGCAISTASASLMTEMLRGRSREEADRIFEEFEPRFIRRNIQGAILWRAIIPWNAVALMTPWLSRRSPEALMNVLP